MRPGASRLIYEQELQQLRQRLTPEKPSHLLDPAGAAATSHISQKRMRRWSEDREAMMTRSLRRLREQIVRANLLAQEAGFIAEEMSKRTEYLVTLQIPAANLDANRKRDVVLSEPAIQVRRKGKGKQIWALEKMENRLVDMRELYQEWKDFDEDNAVMRSYFKRADPFFDEQENHSLIGVANVFLACLFYDVKLQYAVPIINQKGEVAGRLHVEVRPGTESSEEDAAGQSNSDGDTQDRKLDCVVKILQANGLPRHLSNFVFCQYHFWGQQESVFIAPEMQPSSSPAESRDPQCTVVFDSAREFSVSVSEDFVEFLADGAVAIEVYGHKQANHRRNLALWDLGVIQAKTRTLRERWSEATRHLELWVQLMELNEAGQFTPVEVLPAKDVHTGGVFQLRQGQSRRVQVEVRPVPESGTMPLIAASILSVSIGDVKIRQTRVPRGSESHWGGDEEMDSYQEADLERLREQWLVTLTQRQEYLDQQLQKIVSKPDKSEDDVERESQLLECRLTLTEERNAVLVPSAGSGIPGAPVERVPVSGMETHIPVLFLDLSADDFQSSLSAPLAGGLDALLSGEEEDDFFDLHIVKHFDPEVKVEASWDSTVHDCPQLSRVAPADQRVYLTVSTVVQLSHPAHMQLVLRKRICVNVTGRQGFAQSLLKRMSQCSTIPGCGVTFEIVSNIPGDIHGPEDREMLARLAASTEDDQSADSEAAIEKYLRSVLAVENVLTLDRLRQEVAVKEQLAVRGKAPRRCLSSPNIHRLSASSLDLYSSTHRLNDFKGWESHQDLSYVPPPSRLKAVPKLLKSLLPVGRAAGKEQTAVHQQSLPRIMVQSVSVEEGMSKHQQPVPIEAIIPDLQTESPRSKPLPPPIIPETEDSLPSPTSESSSGYISTSMSTATLADVYTLSWDLPPSDVMEALPDEEDEDDGVTYYNPYPELIFREDQSEPQESFLVLDHEAAEERPDSPPSKPDVTPSDSNLSQQEPNESPSVQEQNESESVAESHLLQESTVDNVASEQLDHFEPLEDSMLVEENETKQTEIPQTEDPKLEAPSTEELELAATDETEAELSLHHETQPSAPEEDLVLLASSQELSPHHETQQSAQKGPSEPAVQDQTTCDSVQDPTEYLVPAVPEVLVSAPASSGDLFSASSQEQATTEASNLKDSSVPTSSSTTDEVQEEEPVDASNKTSSADSLSSVQPSKPDTAVANPFKIKKVKSSDLMSFQRIVGEEEDQLGQMDRASSLGAGLNLSVPMETLEIISDSEEGDATAVLPDWLKEGEFVTVGNNKNGTVRYLGPTDFAVGTWVGVELEVPAGKNDGSVGGKHYFHCNPGYGVLVRPHRVSRGAGKRRRQQQKRRSANLSGSSPNLAALTALAKGEGGVASAGRSRGENRKSWNT
ncbi:Kinesin-like protein KIF13B [Dissostichus eleginoides]|uniref:Kinesin-like protein KIF13B n=1 Tax=Dissostichus eleginoides TaxID=100907 RepID=A0AAD9BUP2_DISEL|nr:Kinesin-like protein KIF13B [Dissostichus eleginoides]